jgi:DNA-binding transcriptional regulator YiaG
MSGKKLRKRRPPIRLEKRPESAQWLVKIRWKLALTQAELANHLGICTHTVLEWEKKGVPERGTGAKLLRIKIDELTRMRIRELEKTDQ